MPEQSKQSQFPDRYLERLSRVWVQYVSLCDRLGFTQARHTHHFPAERHIVASNRMFSEVGSTLFRLP